MRYKTRETALTRDAPHNYPRTTDQPDFTRTLLLNEYPPHWIQDTQLKPHTTRSRQPDNNIDWLYH